MTPEDSRFINKTLLWQLMGNPPKAQRLFEAFNGDWNALTLDQIKEVQTIIQNKFIAIDDELLKEIIKRQNSETLKSVK